MTRLYDIFLPQRTVWLDGCMFTVVTLGGAVYTHLDKLTGKNYGVAIIVSHSYEIFYTLHRFDWFFFSWKIVFNCDTESVSFVLFPFNYTKANRSFSLPFFDLFIFFVSSCCLPLLFISLSVTHYGCLLSPVDYLSIPFLLSLLPSFNFRLWGLIQQ